LIDGVYGAGTREAIAQWQRSENHNITGVIADAEASLLEQAASRHRSATTLIQPIASNQAADKADDRQRQPIPAQLQPGAKRTAFANTYHVVAWPTYDELRANPFPFKDKVVGVDALFSRMISENEGMFGDLLVINLPSSQFKEEGRRYMLAIKVLGIRSIKTPMGVEFPAPYGSYVGAYECGNLFVRCSE
jgi:peptidoglycan hydrolase-like protein with peptidoglycan-binding domain